MYTEALAQQRIFFGEKMVLKLGFILLAMAVFSGQNMPIDAYYTGGSVIKNYIHENITEKEQNDALFLLREKWNSQIEEKYGKNKIVKIDEGIIYTKMVKYINSRKIKINIAEINRSINPDIEILPVMASDKMHSKSSIKNIAENNNAIVAVNGTYYKQNTGTPLGTLVINNEIISGPIYERVAFAINKEGFETARISFEGYIKNNKKKITIDNINQPRMLASNVLVYTPKWGKTAPLMKKTGLYIAVGVNKIIEISNKPLAIPENGFVISGPKEKLNSFQTGDKVEYEYGLNPNMDKVRNIISGGPYLIKDGEIFIDTTAQKLKAITGRNPRTAVGYTKDNVMILVTVEGRKEGSSGMTLYELAKLMKELGCYEAINLDGGSSTAMYADGIVFSGSNIKNPVRISNILAVKFVRTKFHDKRIASRGCSRVGLQ